MQTTNAAGGDQEAAGHVISHVRQVRDVLVVVGGEHLVIQLVDLTDAADVHLEHDRHTPLGPVVLGAVESRRFHLVAHVEELAAKGEHTADDLVAILATELHGVRLAFSGHERDGEQLAAARGERRFAVRHFGHDRRNVDDLGILKLIGDLHGARIVGGHAVGANREDSLVLSLCVRSEWEREREKILDFSV